MNTAKCIASALALAAGCVSAAAGAAGAYGPDTCRQGYVWREAYAGDHVCVTPAVREQAARDNRMANSRRAVEGGAYGRDTCRPGYVWRETRRSDHVCVTPSTRTQAANDNRQAASRRAGSRSVAIDEGTNLVPSRE